MRQTLRAGSFEARVEKRASYLLIVEGDDDITAAQMREYLDAVDRAAERAGTKNVMFDARGNHGPYVADVHAERWEFLTVRTKLERVAVLLPRELDVSRVNMTAIAKRGKARVRAFADEAAAEKWLSSG
ncbi:STAS/SEC14 domain-containing protein [Sandaracinus amylolyticus]|uniref:STAS/SEC14 domain-containing protein n=1 Tax=Sandaracinus amylolyticus TaxID=927083 RepID=A0A0F6SDP3_9BACT|nr:STAS/SEC14 domain-containing protein [Sandaracinus amylolyticus]AKF03794.1 hypothetical protein DB32_000943 [Sandaracinus amylolyticus]